MYYEGRVSQIVDVPEAALAETLRNPSMDIIYRTGKYGFANDASTCEGILELAILDLESNTQIESLTMGWVPESGIAGVQAGVEAFRKCCNNPFSQRPTGLVFEGDKVVRQPESWYTCGCCGESFKSTHSVQKKFDQDAGYGICGSCENWYS